MKKDKFEDYLQEIWWNEGHLKDEFPDGFNDWLVDMDVDTMIEYAEKWGSVEQIQPREETTICQTCKNNNMNCPVLPESSSSCVEYEQIEGKEDQELFTVPLSEYTALREALEDIARGKLQMPSYEMYERHAKRIAQQALESEG